MYELTDTICALATPPGTSGIAVIRISGPEAFRIVDSVLKSGKRSCASRAGHTLHRATVVDDDGSPIDDVLIAIFHGPRSYTGDDVIELSAHGSRITVRRILDRLTAAGARTAAPGEFTRRAFLAGKLDLAQAEAVGDLIAAETDEAQRQAGRQLAGRLSAQVSKIRDRILGVMAQIEAAIDFPEDVGDLNRTACSSDLALASSEIETLLATARRGILLRDGARVALVGRPNVGKSSLLNALLRADRAIVAATPGTTRDVIEESANIHGIPVRLQDTAGLRTTGDDIERIGVARTDDSIRAADFVLLILDSSAGETDEDRSIRQKLDGVRSLTVWNKRDLNPGFACPPNEIAVSAQTGLGLIELESHVAALLAGGEMRATEADATIVTSVRHREALLDAQRHLQIARESLESDLPEDLVSIDVQESLLALGRITGESAPDELLDEIFSRFCIGK